MTKGRQRKTLGRNIASLPMLDNRGELHQMIRARIRAIKDEFQSVQRLLLSVGIFLSGPLVGGAFAGPGLVSELGCGNCHIGGAKVNPFAGQIPNLKNTGERYTATFLHELLQKGQLRRKKGAAGRMPVFPMSKDERDALVGFLSARRVDKPDGMNAVTKGFKAGNQDAVARGRKAFDAYGCIGCHAADGAGGGVGPSLDSVPKKLKPAWVESYLIDPKLMDPSTSMVNLFYVRKDGRYRPVRSDRDVGQDLTDLLSYLFRDGILADPPPTDAHTADGKRIYTALRCDNCHQLAKPQQFAPDLTKVSSRFNERYLLGYLAKPVPRRPFGALAGDGSRMPNFKLASNEVKEIAKWMTSEGTVSKTRSPLKLLSAFGKKKAARLLAEKMSCLGCHQWGGEGGRIAPELKGTGVRLKRSYIHDVLFNTRTTVGHSVMPQVRGRPTVKTMYLIQALLEQSQDEASPGEYLALTNHETLARSATDKAQQNYEKYCAACHGVKGEQDGFNAAYLPVKPARLASSKVLARRPDDTLYDVLAVGGFVLGKSHRMPPWGDTLSRTELWELVKYLRKLCNCSQPAWAGSAP